MRSKGRNSRFMPDGLTAWRHTTSASAANRDEKTNSLSAVSPPRFEISHSSNLLRDRDARAESDPKSGDGDDRPGSATHDG